MLGETSFQAMKASIEALESQTRTAKPADLVDCTQRLRQFKDRLTELDESWSNQIKDYCSKKNVEHVSGLRWVAAYKYVKRMCLNTEKVREYLGKKAKDFEYDAGSYRLTFKPKMEG